MEPDNRFSHAMRKGKKCKPKKSHSDTETHGEKGPPNKTRKPVVRDITSRKQRHLFPTTHETDTVAPEVEMTVWKASNPTVRQCFTVLLSL